MCLFRAVVGHRVQCVRMCPRGTKPSESRIKTNNSGQSNCAQIFSLTEGWQTPSCTVRRAMTGRVRGRGRRATCRCFSRESRLSVGGRLRRSWRSLPSTPAVRKMPRRASAMAGKTRIHQKEIPLDPTFPKLSGQVLARAVDMPFLPMDHILRCV